MGSRWNPGGCKCCDCGTVCVTVLRYDGGPLSGATVHVTLGGTDIADSPCTTSSLGVCCIPVPSANTYQITVSHGSYTTFSAPYALTCTTNNITIQLTLPAASNCTLKVYPIICGNPLVNESISVTITFSGGFTVTLTTGTAGYVEYIVPPSISVGLSCTAAARSAAGTSSTITTCAAGGTQGVQLVMSPASGYACPCQLLAFTTQYPIKTVLNFTESAFGEAFTLTYDPTVSYWIGTSTYSYPGCTVLGTPNCPAKTAGIVAVFSQTVFTPADNCLFGFSALTDAIMSLCPDNVGGSSGNSGGDVLSGTLILIGEWTPAGGVFSAVTTSMVGTGYYFRPGNCIGTGASSVLSVTE